MSTGPAKSYLFGLLALVLGALCFPGVLMAQKERIYDSHGIPYAAIDAEPCLGRIQARNPGYNILVAQLFRGHSLKPGTYVGLRRDGVIVCFAFVEAVERGPVATLEVLLNTTGFHPITIPAIGDEVIRIPNYSTSFFEN